MNTPGVINIEPDSSVINGSSSQDAIEIIDDEDLDSPIQGLINISSAPISTFVEKKTPDVKGTLGKTPADVINASNAKQVLHNPALRNFYDPALSCRSGWFLEFTWLQYTRSNNMLSCIFCSQTTSNGSMAVGRDPLKTRRIDLVVHSQTDTHIQIADHFTSGKDSSSDVITVQSSSKFCNLRKILLKRKDGKQVNPAKAFTFIDVSNEFEKSGKSSHGNAAESYLGGSSNSNETKCSALSNLEQCGIIGSISLSKRSAESLESVDSTAGNPNLLSGHSAENSIHKKEMFSYDVGENRCITQNEQAVLNIVPYSTENRDTVITSQKSLSPQIHGDASTRQKKRNYNQPHFFSKEVVLKMIKEDGNKKRLEFLMSHFRLKLDWFMEFDWLEYKTAANRFYCKYCRLHNTSSIFAKGKFAMASRSKRNDFLIHMETDMHKNVMITSGVDKIPHQVHRYENYVQNLSDMASKYAGNTDLAVSNHNYMYSNNDLPTGYSDRQEQNRCVNSSSLSKNTDEVRPIKVENTRQKRRKSSTLIVIEPDEEEFSLTSDVLAKDQILLKSKLSSNVNDSHSDDSLDTSLSRYLVGNSKSNKDLSLEEMSLSKTRINRSKEVTNEEDAGLPESGRATSSEYINNKNLPEIVENPIDKLCHVVNSYTYDGKQNGSTIRRNKTGSEKMDIINLDCDSPSVSETPPVVKETNNSFIFKKKPQNDNILNNRHEDETTNRKTESSSKVLNTSECDSTHSIEKDLAILQSEITSLEASSSQNVQNSSVVYSSNRRSSCYSDKDSEPNVESLYSVSETGSVSMSNASIQRTSSGTSLQTNLKESNSPKIQTQQNCSFGNDKYFSFHEIFWPLASCLRQQNILCDVTLAAYSNDGQLEKIQVHQLILACASDYLKKKFVSPSASDKKKTFMFPNITAKGLKGVIDFLYGQNVAGDSKYYRECYHAARVLGVKSAENIFKNFISNTCSKKEVYEITLGLPSDIPLKCLVHTGNKRNGTVETQCSYDNTNTATLSEKRDHQCKGFPRIKRSPRRNSHITDMLDPCKGLKRKRSSNDQKLDDLSYQNNETESKKVVTEYRFLSKTPPMEIENVSNHCEKVKPGQNSDRRILNIKCYICRKKSQTLIVNKAKRKLWKASRKCKILHTKIVKSTISKRCIDCVKKFCFGYHRKNKCRKVLNIYLKVKNM